VLETQGIPGSSADELRVVDEDDQDVPAGEVGQLLTRGPYTIRGYFAAESHNAAAFTSDGFYRTGDLVRVLPSGHLVVEGRAKDQINKGGEKIASQEVEEALAEHPDVLDVAVVAMPDAALGERACAFVVPRSEALSGAELRQFLTASGLATYKVPDRFELVGQLPTTSVGKVDKKLLRHQASTVRSAGVRAPDSEAASIKAEGVT
jgi:2,3-dihydroxybenzoate-AMP ligase